MTNNRIEKKKEKPKLRFFISIIALLLLLSLSTLLSDEIALYTKRGLEICFYSVVGAVFPFMILTDAFVAFSDFSSSKRIKAIFERLFSINGCGICAFIAGIFCGFPMGIKVARDLYLSGRISKEECERLIGFSTAPSPAFLISAVGLGMRGSAKDGAILYISTILSLVLVGIIFGIGKKHDTKSEAARQTDFNIVKSLSNAASGTLFICSVITFFSVVIGLFEELFSKDALLILVPFMEISTASAFLAEFDGAFIFSLCAFACSFSGISVILQGKHLLFGTGISINRYIKMKLLSGVIAALIASLLLSAFK